ncbi:MAG: TonB-dependent receptor [Spirosoma sp.]|uniref:SusC/RagA family TonB-linked outer membrane protein n=2 Tax=unclassified Spirosoma TaxID=2621999 RepID=UPI0009690D0D|nr:TonB-dependent receptor [Spirosoma sp. 48-14]MBN8822344.1 TonB-dependent receptor [Spirosoma sp.]OJW72689.1 MAG: SusC/RagA family TonB-linked outer membrane protein [Spirosoma sp. 48-14]
MKKKLKSTLPLVLLVVVGICSCIPSMAQQLVKGTVRSKEDEAPMPFVSVLVKGTQTGATTNAEGNFSIAAASGQTLVFSFVGYKAREVTLAAQTTLDITLEPESTNLSEVLVVGYGTQARDKVTTAISRLDNKVLENIPYQNAASSLQGTIAGVRVQSVSGQPGAAPRVILRGGTSINNPNGAAPLYIIDGVIRPNLNDISSEEIESMQVLKDAASTAIYGARASNGVVIVTTKSGKTGKLRVNYQYNLSSSELAKGYELASARDLLTYQRLGVLATAQVSGNATYLTQLTGKSGYGTGNDLTNSTAFTTQYLTDQNKYKLNEGWESMPDPADPSKTIIFKGTNFQDVLFRTAISQNHHLSLSGGSEKATFSAGLGYMDAQGIVITTNYQRLNFDMNGELLVNDRLKLFGRMMYSRSGNNQVFSNNSIFERSLDVPMTTKYVFEDGSLAPGLAMSLGNPEYYLNKLKGKNLTTNLSMAVGGHWQILPGLSFDPQLSLYETSGDGRSFQQAYYNGPTSYITSRAATGLYGKRTQYQADGVFSYAKLIQGVHNVEVKLGFSYYQRDTTGLSAAGQGASSDLIPTLNASATPVSVSGYESRQVLVGYFSRINYDYMDKYLVSLNARYDGASNLGASHQWGFFPGVSVGWNLHRENFWKSISEDKLRLKLRASYGVNGNIAGLNDFQAQGQYSVGSLYNGNSAITNTILPNANLQWERSKTVDLGADVGLWNNRISMLIDVYRRVTDNLLTDLSLPLSTGFSSVRTNLGSLENKGIELELRASVLPSNSALQWVVSVNATKTQQKILKLPENGNANNRIGGIEIWDDATKSYVYKGGLQEGGRVGDMFSYKQLGIYATDEQAAKAPIDYLITRSNRTKYGGDVIWLDADGNGSIDARDRVYVGNPYPTWTGGFSNTLTYKGLSFYARADYTTGHTIFNYPRAQMIGQFQGDINISKEALQSWKKPGDQTEVPKYYWADQNAQNNLFRNATGANGSNSRYYESGDFLCFREVSLSYSLPKKLASVAKLQGVRLNLTAQNLGYITGYKGLNPEEGGTDRGRYPLPRTFMLGLNVTL